MTAPRSVAPAAKRAPAADPGLPQEHPARDPKWAQIKWTVYRGVAYDITDFIPRHPGGSWLANLALHRDCTALFESYHLRCDIAQTALRKLPQLDGFPVTSVTRAPYPNDSDAYVAIRQRVRKEVFQGSEHRGQHRRGSELAATAVISFAVAMYALYLRFPCVLTGALLGVAGAWIGVTIQHCGNHGAMSTSPLVNLLLGSCDDIIGGSSLMWRYHHQVSHHIHTNDEVLDEDVCSMYPLLRFDTRLPRRWWHRYQHIYVWFAYPTMHLAFQLGDLQSLLTGRTIGAELLGAASWEKASVLLGKVLHYGLVLGVPWLLHGASSALLGAAVYSACLSLVLAVMFFVSHNVPESKPLAGSDLARSALLPPLDSRDWGVQQITASANWGGVVGNFFTGGLNLQIEHHLFPAISFVHYPAIAKVVADECAKRGISYASYPHLPAILTRFCACVRDLGAAPDEPLQPASKVKAY